MASDFRLSVAARNAACDAIVALVDSGPGPGTIKIRSGSAPAVNAASTGTLLATLTFSDPAFGAASGGTATANSITSDSNADADGTAGHFRVYPAGGLDTSPVFQGNCGIDSEAPNMSFGPDAGDNDIVESGIVSCSAFSVTVPQGP